MELLNALIHSFIHLFNKYLQVACHVPGTVSGAGDEMTKHIRYDLCPYGADSLVRGTESN